MQATITSKGHTTLPKALREQLQLSAGDRVELILDEDKAVRMLPHLGSIRDLKGILPKPAKPVSLEQMDEAL